MTTGSGAAGERAGGARAKSTPTPLPQTELWKMLRTSGAYREGHFLLTSGRHSPQFFLFSQLMQYPAYGERLGRALAGLCPGSDCSVVAGPAMGGVLLAYEVARALGIRAMFTEKAEGGGMALRRGFRLAPAEVVLLVEDALSTGGSLRQALTAIESAGGRVAAATVVVDRSGGQVDLPVPVHSLLQFTVPSYRPEECPLCRAGVPLERPKGTG